MQTLTAYVSTAPAAQGFDDGMVKRAKTKKPARKKAGGLAALAKLPRQDENEFEAYPDPWAPPGKGPPPRPPGWKSRLPGPLPPNLRPHRIGGAPLQDPEDRRDAHFAMRMHENLMEALRRNSRRRGWKVSQYVEKILIDAVNAEAGSPIVDAVRRYRSPQDQA
ncbi:MAG: hypothetical protein K2Z80_37085 [Xanthobacteraceae bacterium]|nr:hypothetical protein [Xanthobacteraceae bacterium]